MKDTMAVLNVMLQIMSFIALLIMLIHAQTGDVARTIAWGVMGIFMLKLGKE